MSGIENIRREYEASRLEEGFALLARDDDSNYDLCEEESEEFPDFVHHEIKKAPYSCIAKDIHRASVQKNKLPTSPPYRELSKLANSINPESVIAHALPDNVLGQKKGGTARTLH
jgi:hypothetical protein